MTHHSERRGGFTSFAIGMVLAFAILMGSGLELGFEGRPDDRVFLAAIIVLSAFTVIGIGIGSYNMGRSRGDD